LLASSGLARSRNSAQRRRCAAEIRFFPASVRGPVESPPWNRQRRLPASILMAHGRPCRFWAPHGGRSLWLNGEPSPARPIVRMDRHEAPMPHAESVQVLLAWSEQHQKPYSCQLRQASWEIKLAGGGPAWMRSASSFRSASSAAAMRARMLLRRLERPRRM
jgi:hypothetical protein